VDSNRIGATGMNMGGTRANWLAALDNRIKTTVSVACLARMQDFLKTDNIKWHAFLIGFQACIDENAKGMVAIYN